MLLIFSLILIGFMCSMKIVSLHMIERQKVEERYVYCPKCDAKIRSGNSAPFCLKCNLIFFLKVRNHFIWFRTFSF
ncbi:hypothetical protein CN325_11485 [Bacillus thuringiensis]|nr:hypothetical protein CN325_11485 [Bacillus thuringiensis]